MKYLTLFLLITFLPLFAQSNKVNDTTALEIQTKEWMTKISSDPKMRGAIMAMILDETTGNKEEMMKLGKTIRDNPDMNSIIAGMMQRNTNSDNMTVPSRDMMGDSNSNKTMKMSGYKLKPRK